MNTPLKLSIRPEVNTQASSTNPAEIFQNQSLRPILKLQNELLIALTMHFLDKRKTNLDNKDYSTKKILLQHAIRKDNSLRNQLLGCVIGQFTLEEWHTYQSMETESRRRIFSMLEQRLIDQMLDQAA